MLAFYVDSFDRSLQSSLRHEQLLVFYCLIAYAGCAILLHFLCSKIKNNYCERKDMIPRFLRHIGWYDVIVAFLSIFFVVALFEAASTPQTNSIFGEMRDVIVIGSLVISLVLIISHSTVTGYYLIFAALFSLKGLSTESENFINRNRRKFVVVVWICGLLPSTIYFCTASYQNQSLYIFANDAIAQMICLIVLIYKRRKDRYEEESGVVEPEATVVYPLYQMIGYRMASITLFLFCYHFSKVVVGDSIVSVYIVLNHLVTIYAFPLIFIFNNRILAKKITVAALTRRKLETNKMVDISIG